MKNKPLFSFALFIACFMGVLAYGQTQVAPFVNSHVQFSNASGAAPCNGCLLSTFAAGTTTPLATYSESTGTTPNANPVVLASDGSATIYLTNASYKFVLKTGAGATIWTQDQVTWNNLATTLSSLTLTGNATINSSTAATNVANQSGPTFCMDGNFWNGSASAVDSWCWNDVLGSGANPTSTLTLVHSGSSGTPVFSVPALSASSATISGATAVGSLVDNGNANIKGPEPWADVTKYGLTCDSGVVDNTAAWNTFLAGAQAANIHVAYFPTCTGGKYRFASKPNGIGIELKIVCANKPVQWNPTGTLPAAQLLADYNEVTATNAFIDFTGSTSPGNSGIVGCQIWKATTRTGGTAIKYEGTSTTARAGAGPIEDVRISGDGTWNWGLRVDCTNITTAGSQGCRDIAVRNLDIFQTTTGAMSINDAVHFKWIQGGTFPAGGGSAHVDVTGVTGAGGNSVNIEFTDVEILDTLALDWVTNFACSACYVNNLTTTVNTIASTFEGIVSAGAPTINGQLAYWTFDTGSPAGFGIGLVNSIHATNFIASGAAPSAIVSGDISAAHGTYWFGLFNPTNTQLQETVAGRFIFKTPATNPLYGAGASSPSFGCWRTSNSTNRSRLCDDSADAPISYGAVLISPTAPTIAVGGCGGAAASIATNNGTAAFSVNVGTTPTTACTITMPTATNGWNCFATDITTNSTTVFLQKQTATGATSVTITNFNDVAVGANFTASDILQVSCFAR